MITSLRHVSKLFALFILAPSSLGFLSTPSNCCLLHGGLPSVKNPVYQMDDSILALEMKSVTGDGSTTRRMNKLDAVSVFDGYKEPEKESRWMVVDGDFIEASLLPVLSASFLITGNTVGAGMLVLPELAEGPGMGISASIFASSFLINLVSGLIIAEIGINQHAASGNDVPSSFKDFAQVNLNSKAAAIAVSLISIFVNALVMAFNTIKVGDMWSGTFQGTLSTDAVSLAWVGIFTALVGTQTFSSLSKVASLLVTGLFVSFAGIVVPGLAHMTADPMAILSTPGTSPYATASAGELAPVILMSLVYQNIVPTVTKLNDYDRTKTTLSIVLGSFIPLLMYLAWTFAVIGGGINNPACPEGPLISIFFLTTIAGSSIGCIMSLAEEIESFLPASRNSAKEASPAGDKFSLLSVLVSVCISWIGAMHFENELNDALKIAGSIGSPLLYGILPVVMAFTQRQQSRKQQEQQGQPQIHAAALVALGVASTWFVGNEIAQSAGDAFGMLLSN